MVVLGEGGGQTLLARSEHLVASGSALTEVPVTSVLIRGCVDGQVLTQDITSPGDVPGLLRGVYEQAPLIAMSTSLKLQNTVKFKVYTLMMDRITPGLKVTGDDGSDAQFDSPQSFPQVPGSEPSLPSTDSPCSQYVRPLSKFNNTRQI